MSEYTSGTAVLESRTAPPELLQVPHSRERSQLLRKRVGNMNAPKAYRSAKRWCLLAWRSSVPACTMIDSPTTVGLATCVPANFAYDTPCFVSARTKKRLQIIAAIQLCGPRHATFVFPPASPCFTFRSQSGAGRVRVSSEKTYRIEIG